MSENGRLPCGKAPPIMAHEWHKTGPRHQPRPSLFYSDQYFVTRISSMTIFATGTEKSTL